MRLGRDRHASPATMATQLPYAGAPVTIRYLNPDVNIHADAGERYGFDVLRPRR